MKEISIEALTSASREESLQMAKRVQAIFKQPHTGPLLTIHPKVRKKGNKGQYETRCILNKVAMQKIFNAEAEKYELDLGDATWSLNEQNEETGEYTAQKIRTIMLKVAEEKAQKGKSMVRLQVSPESGLIESDWLATVIYNMEKMLEDMDENTKHHFLLMPCKSSSKEMEDSKKGWEFRWLKSEPADELLIETDDLKN